MSNLWTGGVNTNGDYADLATISGVTFTSGSKYVFQCFGPCKFCEGQPGSNSKGFTILDSEPFQLDCDGTAIYVKNLVTPCIINIAD